MENQIKLSFCHISQTEKKFAVSIADIMNAAYFAGLGKNHWDCALSPRARAGHSASDIFERLELIL